MIAVLAMTGFHPGWCFPQLSKHHRMKKALVASDESIELSEEARGDTEIGAHSA
jgi:hypothetical protein